MSVISGMDLYIAETVSNMGADGYPVTRIFLTTPDIKKFLEMQRRNPQLNHAEFEFLRTHVTMTREMGMVTSRAATLHSGKEAAEAVQVMGASPNVAGILSFEAVEGRYFSEVENRRGLNVVFIGNDIRQKFFPSGNPVGHNISIEGLPFEVVG